MRGNPKMSVFEKHLKLVHADKYELYMNCRNEKIKNLQKPSESNEPESVNNMQDEVILIEEEPILIEDTDEEDQEDEDISMCEVAPSMTSDMTLDESTTKLISELLDEKLSPIFGSGTTANVTNFNNKLTKLSEEVCELRADLKHSEKERRMLEQEIQSLEREMRRNCLLVREIPCDEGITSAEAVISYLLQNIMWITNIQYEKVELLPNTRNNSGRRSIVVTFNNKMSAQYVLSQAYKLRDTGIYMEPFIPQTALKRKAKLLTLRREILRLNPNLIVRVSGTKLSVGGYIFEWNILNYLATPHINSRTKTAVALLNEATGLNLKNFVQILEN